MKKMLWLLMIFPFVIPFSALGQSLTLYGAGSLREAMTEVVKAFSSDYGIHVKTEFGPSGHFRDRIEKGERPDIFTSADVGNPMKLTTAGIAGPTVLFLRNKLCVLAKEGLNLRPDNLLDFLLDPKIRVGTATPKADPCGDYTWEMFKKAEAVRPGIYNTLDKKAIQMIGGPTHGRNYVSVISMGFEKGMIDLFIVYCTAAKEVKREAPGLAVLGIPQPLSVAADYGMTVLIGAKAETVYLALYILSAKGQTIFEKYGFSPIGGQSS